MAAEYIKWRALITSAVVIAARIAVPAPSNVTRVRWAAPAKMIGAPLQPTRLPIPDSVIARPTTRANGMAEPTSGSASITPFLAMERSNVLLEELIGENFSVVVYLANEPYPIGA
jgi:hypothetical protein